jgi:hypothetical protein
MKDDDPVQLRMDDIYDSTIQHIFLTTSRVILECPNQDPDYSFLFGKSDVRSIYHILTAVKI